MTIPPTETCAPQDWFNSLKRVYPGRTGVECPCGSWWTCGMYGNEEERWIAEHYPHRNTVPTGPQSAVEMNTCSLNEAFISHLEREGHEVTSDPVNDFPRKYETFLTGAKFGYSQQPSTAALLAIAAEIKARAEYYRTSDWSESAEICYQWAERIEGVLNRKTAPDEQGGRG